MTAEPQTEAKAKARANRKAPGYVTAAAALMVPTGWAFFAAVPVVALTLATWSDDRIRALRWWGSLTAILYAVPFVQYLLRDDRMASMSDLLNPWMAGAITLSALVVLLKIVKSHMG